MGFLSGSLSFDCYRVHAPTPSQFDNEQVEILEKFATTRSESYSTEPRIGFLAGGHLFDRDFSLEKNVYTDALHFAVRIDTNQVPGAIRGAWLQMELAALMADQPERRPTKAERQEAKEAVEARCEQAIQSGQYCRMQQFPILWDLRNQLLYFGGTSPTAWELTADLLERAFELELQRLSSGQLAREWADTVRPKGLLDDVMPSNFGLEEGPGEVEWWNGETENYDYLGNEFLLWLWWYLENSSDTLELADGSEVTGMFTRTLSLACPRGESGRETISAEGPTQLPEAIQAIRAGKLPRKAGLVLVRHGQQYDFALQAESFSIGGGKLPPDEDAIEPREQAESRIDMLRDFKETLDALFQAFCQRRTAKNWEKELQQIRQWLHPETRRRKAG